MTRQVVLDTETTGLNPAHGHCIIEIGCVEIVGREITGNCYHQYLDPHRPIDREAERIHGLSNRFLRGMPLFSQIRDELMEFIGDADIVAHNASFDVAFLKAQGCDLSKNKIIDTLKLAKREYPKKFNTLDALCKRFEIVADRTLHGALLDAELLAGVYLKLTGGQETLFSTEEQRLEERPVKYLSMDREPLRVIYASDEDLAADKKLRALKL